MADEPQSAGVFYADGHVRVYHGKLTDLPRRYIARERLCLRGTTDYWVNAMDGRPFFVVSCAVDHGLPIPSHHPHADGRGSYGITDENGDAEFPAPTGVEAEIDALVIY